MDVIGVDKNKYKKAQLMGVLQLLIFMVFIVTVDRLINNWPSESLCFFAQNPRVLLAIDVVWQKLFFLCIAFLSLILFVWLWLGLRTYIRKTGTCDKEKEKIWEHKQLKSVIMMLVQSSCKGNWVDIVFVLSFLFYIAWIPDACRDFASGGDGKELLRLGLYCCGLVIMVFTKPMIYRNPDIEDNDQRRLLITGLSLIRNSPYVSLEPISKYVVYYSRLETILILLSNEFKVQWNAICYFEGDVNILLSRGIGALGNKDEIEEKFPRCMDLLLKNIQDLEYDFKYLEQNHSFFQSINDTGKCFETHCENIKKWEEKIKILIDDLHSQQKKGKEVYNIYVEEKNEIWEEFYKNKSSFIKEYEELLKFEVLFIHWMNSQQHLVNAYFSKFAVYMDFKYKMLDLYFSEINDKQKFDYSNLTDAEIGNRLRDIEVKKSRDKGSISLYMDNTAEQSLLLYGRIKDILTPFLRNYILAENRDSEKYNDLCSQLWNLDFQYTLPVDYDDFDTCNDICYRSILSLLKSKNYDDEQVVVNITSGTALLSSVLTLNALKGSREIIYTKQNEFGEMAKINPNVTLIQVGELVEERISME